MSVEVDEMTHKPCLIQFPTGSYGFAGSIPVELAFVAKDGSAPTERQLEIERRCGPGFAKLKSRSWPTAAEALAEASRLGVKVSNASKYEEV